MFTKTPTATCDRRSTPVVYRTVGVPQALLFFGRPEWPSFGLHPNPTGYALMRQAWAYTALPIVYSPLFHR